MIIRKHNDGRVSIHLTTQEVKSFYLIQDKQDDGLSYSQSIHTQIKKGMEKLRDVRTGEIDL